MFITRFKHDQALSREFVDLEYRLYRNDPHWVPPLRRGRLREVGADNPLFQRPGHDRIHFLVHDGHHAVGRLVAAVSPDLRDEDGTPVGTVGMFECDESPAAASALLGAGVEWLREKHGIRRVWGPMNYDIWHGYRLMVRGFERAALSWGALQQALLRRVLPIRRVRGGQVLEVGGGRRVGPPGGAP